MVYISALVLGFMIVAVIVLAYEIFNSDNDQHDEGNGQTQLQERRHDWRFDSRRQAGKCRIAVESGLIGEKVAR